MSDLPERIWICFTGNGKSYWEEVWTKPPLSSLPEDQKGTEYLRADLSAPVGYSRQQMVDLGDIARWESEVVQGVDGKEVSFYPQENGDWVEYSDLTDLSPAPVVFDDIHKAVANIVDGEDMWSAYDVACAVYALLTKGRGAV